MITGGVILDDRYRLESIVAIGGMGEVWRGRDEALKRDVAIKVLKDDAATNVVFLKRFEIEARNAAALGHRNIAQVLDYGTFEGNAYMVMEYVEGESLAAVLEREHVLDADFIVEILAQACQGLQAAHDAGVIHRDIKPGNLLISPDGRVKITDFGVSRTRDQTTLTQTGMVMGTAQYLAPELALGKTATARSDLYALGIIAYEALAGRRPFSAPNPVDIAIAQVNDPVPALPASVDPALASLVMDLLEKNPARRPESASALGARLEALHLPTGAAPPRLGRPVPASIRPRHSGGAPSRPMPPSVPPRVHRPRPDSPGRG